MVALFAISYTPYQTGEFCFKYGVFEFSMPGNFLLIICANILFVILTINKILRLFHKLFLKRKYRESQNGIIELLFSDLDNVNNVLSKFVFLDKYKLIRDGILCYIFEKFKAIPAQFFDTDHAKVASEVLYVKETRLNIIKHLSENNIKEAAILAQDIINKHPKYVVIIFDEILKLVGYDVIKIVPAKYKYNLPQRLIEKYEITYALKHGEQAIIKCNKKYPGSYELISVLDNIITSDTKFLQIVQECVKSNPDRRIATIVAKRYGCDAVIKMCDTMDNGSIEKLWFRCYANLACGMDIAMSNDLLSIIAHKSCNIEEVMRFVIQNYKSLCNNAKIFDTLQVKISSVIE